MSMKKKVLAIIMSAVMVVSFVPTFVFAADDNGVEVINPSELAKAAKAEDKQLKAAGKSADSESSTYEVTAAGSTEIGTYDGDKVYHATAPAGTHTLKFSDFKAEDVMMICRYDLMSNDMTQNQNTCPTFDSLKVKNDELNKDENFKSNASYESLDFGSNTYGYVVYTNAGTYTFFFVSVKAGEQGGATPQEEVTFSTKYGSGKLCSEKYTYYNFMTGKAEEYPMYELVVPAKTEDITLNLSKECLVYNYSAPTTSAADNNYLAGWVTDFTKGAKEVTAKIDSNNDGKPDYLQIQNPYNADYTGGELLFAIKLQYQEEQDKPAAKPSFKSAKLSKSNYTYNGKAKKPSVTVKNNKGKTLKKNTDYTVSYSKGRTKVGTYNVTVKGKGSYKFTKKLTFRINPKGTKLVKVTALGGKKIKASWKKQSKQTSGYQIRVSKKSSMSSAKIVKIKDNKSSWKNVWHVSKGRNYVQVRTYKKIGGKTYYSGWSAKKTVNVK